MDAVFQAEAIKKMTSVDDIDITSLGKKKCAYFLITSDQDTTFDFLASLFISFVFIKNVRYADKHCEDGVLPVRVHILADEIANIGEIPDLKKKISTVRSRGISLSVIFQSIAQMENRYNNNQWQEIIGNCDTQLFLGCTDEVTAKFISNRSGEVTAEREEKTFNNIRKEKRQSYNQRKLLTTDEVLRLDGLEGLIITRGEKILPITKFDYTRHPESKYLQKTEIKDYVPKYTTFNSDTLETNNGENRKGVAYEKKEELLCEQKPEEKEICCETIETERLQTNQNQKKSKTTKGKARANVVAPIEEQQIDLSTYVEMKGGDEYGDLIEYEGGDYQHDYKSAIEESYMCSSVELQEVISTDEVEQNETKDDVHEDYEEIDIFEELL